MIEMMDQGSESWFQVRIGKVTASRVADVIAKTKTGYSATRDNYMAQLIFGQSWIQRQPNESFRD